MLKYRSILTASVAVLALAACGADDVGSGGGDIVINNPDNGGDDDDDNGGDVVSPAASCPLGTTSDGTLTLPDDRGSVRNCVIGDGSTNPVVTSDLTLSNQSGTVYSLRGRVDIGEDQGGDPANPIAGADSATLTIDPGVVVIGATEESFLVINRGSQIDAEGTENSPIIFTSRNNVLGLTPNEPTSSGEWGGLLVLGRAPIGNCDVTAGGGNTPGDPDCNDFAEGTSGDRPVYGGNAIDDDSGNLRYVQIRYSGVGANNSELQGLTTGGVGRETQISYVHVHSSFDDGVEAFGGSQNMDHMVFTSIRDDAVDVDSGYNGAIQFVIAARRPGGAATGDPTVAEIDSNGSEGNLPRTNLRLANFTFVSDRAFQTITLRGGADVAFLNGVVVNTNAGGSCLFVSPQASNGAAAADPAAQERGLAVFDSVVFDCANNFAGTGDSLTFGASVFANGSNNNNTDYVSSLQMIVSGVAVENGNNEDTVAEVADLSQYLADPYGDDLPASALQQVDYIGAVRDETDDWYAGWTCDSDTIDFGNDSSCRVVEFN